MLNKFQQGGSAENIDKAQVIEPLRAVRDTSFVIADYDKVKKLLKQ